MLSAWSNFYVITGSSSAALTGLMFVVISLVNNNRAEMKREGVGTFSTPTVVHLGAAFLISALASAPWPAAVNAAVIFGLVSLGGMAYAARIMSRIGLMRASYEPDVDDWVWYAILPLASYAAVGVTALLLATATATALFILAAAVLLLIFIGIHNAWDVVTFITIVQRDRDERDDKPQ